jgi:hypothetical protein
MPYMFSEQAHAQMRSIMDDILKTHIQKEDDVLHIFQTKVPSFIDKTLRQIELRDEQRVHIDTCINQLFKTYESVMMYNGAINGYYKYDEDTLTIKMITSDYIWIQLRPCVPFELHAYRESILKSVIGLIRKTLLFEWTPPPRLRDTVVQMVSLIFNGCLKRTYSFMYIIGAIILKDVAILSDIVHVWYGEYTSRVLEIVQYIVSQVTQSYSPSWNRLRSRYHHSYQLDDVSFLHFNMPSKEWQNWLASLTASKEAFVVSCCHIFRERKYTVLTFPRHHAFTDVEKVWQHYRKQLPIPHASASCYVTLEEITLDLHTFLKASYLQKNLLSSTDVKRFADGHFTNRKHRSNVSTLYAVELNNTTYHDTFRVFCSEILSSSEDTISTGRLYNTFEIWIKCIPYNQNNTQDAQQMCPYNIFDAFLHEKYMPTEDGVWKVRVDISCNMARHYIQAYIDSMHLSTKMLSISTKTHDFMTFKKWCIRKYGAFNLQSDNPDTLETEIRQELISYYDVKNTLTLY